ncbi:MAG: two-component system sensor histidine kinase NtrB [Promethearchaeota archaeon]
MNKTKRISFLRDKPTKPTTSSAPTTSFLPAESVVPGRIHTDFEAFSLLASGIAHDFNNILTSISGNLSLMLMDIENKEELLENIQNALTGVQRATSLTAQLLRFSKGGEPIKSESSLQDIITDSARFVLSGSGVSLDYHFPDGLIPNVKVDPDQISQVIQNIILNAKQAMHNKGKIKISLDIDEKPSAKNIFFPKSLDPSQGYIKIIIEDNGPGIDEEHRKNISTPYFTTKSGGCGLGLATSQNILTKHNGMLDFDSREGHGTEFYIYIPIDLKE